MDMESQKTVGLYIIHSLKTTVNYIVTEIIIIQLLSACSIRRIPCLYLYNW